MGYNNDPMGKALDDHITGHYGEDQFSDDGLTLDEWLADNERGIDQVSAELSEFYRWSLNYDFGNSPFNLFRDLVGWSGDVVGTNLYNHDENFSSLGYMEADLLADALKLWATRPLDVELWLNVLDGLEHHENGD